MLSLNNDEIRPEVACASPLGGKDYTCCIANKHRQTKMVNNCCVVGCTNYVGKVNRLFSIGSRWLIEQKAAAVGRDLRKPKAHTRICGEHFNVGWLG